MWVLMSTLFLVQCVCAIRRDIVCCNKQTNGFRQCRNACAKFAAETDVTRRYKKLKELPIDCPGHLTQLWRCLNRTNPATYAINPYMSSKMPDHAGLCCLLTRQPQCRKDCLSGALSALNKSCALANDQYHPSLISCVHRHEVTTQCCHGASRGCIKACKLLFASEKLPRRNMKTKFKNHCSKYREVLKCVEKNLRPIKKTRGGDQLPCCSKARSNGCARTCRKELLSNKDNKSVIEGIKAVCKGPYELFDNNDMWTCFLESRPVKTPVIPPNESTRIPSPYKDVDGGNLQCCSKAVTPMCWTLCSDMYHSPLGVPKNYQKFDRLCNYNPQEAALRNCLADVTKPCQLGCSGLNFCTNFNNRHTELFRSCDSKSDSFAKKHMQQWHDGIIKVPGIPIVVQDIKTCLPDTWKAIACLLQIKPCSLKSHRSTICKSDCIHILQKCGNTTKYASKEAVKDVCNKLSPSETNCISITKYLKPSKYKDVTDEVTHPCNPNPCPKSKICNIERTCYAASPHSCEPYSCRLGCHLGDESSLLVPAREYAIMPVHRASDGCFKLCYCKKNGRLDQCTRVNCVTGNSCFVKAQNRTSKHGEHFMVDCNYCVCFAGELMCTRRKCVETLQVSDSEPGRPKRNHTPMHTGLPCGCPSEYRPVCTTNGHTHYNPCIARCAGFKDSQMQTGNCESIDPCEKNPCKKGQRCLINRRTCLSKDQPCEQYNCKDIHCKNIHIVEPACDTQGLQHPNQCSLQLKGRKIAYKGFCKAHCNNNPVCGVNGETYSSPCAALSLRVLVDYAGPCKDIGHGPGVGSEGRCKNVKCPPVVPSNCVGVYPPGACCPQCGAQVSILLSQAQLNINSESLSGQSYSPPTLENLLTALRRHVTTTECDLFGYQSLEGDIIILIKAITNKPTTLQIEACSLEAQKIGALINTATPSFTSHFILSTLKFADTQTPSLSAQVQGSSRHLMSVEYLIIALIHTYLIIKWTLSS